MRGLIVFIFIAFIFANSFAQKTIKYEGQEYSLAIHRFSLEKQVLVKERFPVNVKITCLSYIRQEDVPKIHNKLGANYTITIQNSIVNSAIRIVFGKYKLEELLSIRRKEAELELSSIVSQKFIEYHIQLRDLIIEKIIPTKQIQNILEQKYVALQEIEQQKYLLEVERKKLEMQKIRIEAEAERNLILDKSLTEKVLQLKYIETLKVLAESSNTKVIIFSDKKMNIPKMLKEE